MTYNLSQDIKSIQSILDISQSNLADELHMKQSVLSKFESGDNRPTPQILERIYSFAFSKNIRLHKLQEMFWRDNLEKNNVLLFHGAKDSIHGKISIHKGRSNNDFGQGFYAGENYDQAVSFVSSYNNSSVYFLNFNRTNLVEKRCSVDQEWMLTIAYYRGSLGQYESHPKVQKLIQQSRDCDYIIAPIADNRMFQIINSFIEGDITDEQCRHSLAASNLGMQYILLSEKAVSQLKIIEHCYISSNEKEHYQTLRTQETKLGKDKVKIAKTQYRGKGHYIDEIFK